MDFSVGSTLRNVFLPNNNPVNVAKQGLIFTSRQFATGDKIVVPTSGQPVPPLYTPFQLPAFTDGISALVYMKDLGYNYTIGLTYDETLPAPASVTTNNITGIITLTWNSAALGLQQLESLNATGTITQTNTSVVSTASIREVRVIGNQSFIDITLVSGSATFTTSNPVSLAAVLNEPVPNPATSDRACIIAWAFYNQFSTAPQFTTTPNLWLSVTVAGRDASISPTATAIAIGAPTAVDVLPDTTVNLTFAIDDDNLGLLPTTYLGSTIVTQGSNTATYNGYSLTPTECIINILNPSAAFVTGTAVTIELDPTQNGGVLTGKTEINDFGLDANVQDTTTLTTTHADFYNLIISFQQPDTVQQNKFNVKGYYGYSPAYFNQVPVSAITSPDLVGFYHIVRLDIPSSIQFPNDPGANVAAMMFENITNEIPYYETSGDLAIINFEGSTAKNTIPNKDILNQLATQGCTALGVNPDLTVFIYRNQTTLQTNGGKIDTEFRFTACQQKVRWLDKNLYLAGEAAMVLPNGQRRNNDPESIANVKANMDKVLADGVKDGMLGNTNNQVQVIIDPDDVTKLRATVTTTIVSGDSGINTTVFFKSYSI